MLFLLLAVICSATISLLMRISERYRCGNVTMLSMNYLMCCVLAGVFTGVKDVFPADPGLATALGLGVVGGVVYLAAFLLLQRNVSVNGVVLSSTFMKLGILVPTILSVTLFGEIPGVLQIVGLVLALAAILVLQGKGGEASKHFVLLIALLLVGGLADTMSKFFEEWGTQSLQNQFLLYIFATAFVLCLVLCVVRKQRFSPYDFLFGLVIGIPNYLSSRFLLLSLGQVSAILAYPMFSVGTILAVAILGALLFKERLNRRKLLSLGMILAALVLLNL